MTLQQDGERVSSGDADETSAEEAESRASGETGDEADAGTVGDGDGAGDTDDKEADPGAAGDTEADPDDVRPSLQGREFWFQVGALVVASIVLASGLFAWWNAARDAEPTGLGDSRDAALIAARSEIETMNTLDYRKVEEGVAAWSSVTTGVLHDQMLQMTPDQLKLLADAKKVSVGKVLDAAVMDVTATTATVIASIEVTIQDHAVPDSEPTVKRNRLTADLAKVDGEWLLENVQQVGVNLS